MKRTLIAIAALSLSFAAAATEQIHNKAQAAAKAQASAGAKSTSSATGGFSSATGGTAIGGTTSTVLDYERNAPAIAVGSGMPLPTGCRYVFGIGGSNVGGSVGVAGVPLWKDSECKGAAFLATVARFPGLFTQDDVKLVICNNFDAASETQTCKDIAPKQQPVTTSNYSQN